MSNKLRSFVLYGADNKVVPMSLLRLKKPPQTSVSWVEITDNICCTDADTIRQGSKFKAFVGIDARGNTLSGPIIRYSEPKNGKWLQIKYDLCCDTALTVPEITTQPEDEVVTEGNDAVFSAVATGGELTYKWQFNNGVDGWLDVTEDEYATGVTTSTLTLPDIDGSIWPTGTLFRVVITNDAGETNSESATLTVNTP